MKGLVLNLGLKGIRAIIFDSEGKAIASSYQRVQTFLNKDQVEQDPIRWWEKGLECIKEALQKENGIEFITVTTSAACLVPVDTKGNPLMKAIMVADKRAHKEALVIKELESFKELPFKSNSYYSIPRILWIKNNLPDVYEKTYKFLSSNDYFVQKMTGKFHIDSMNASKYYTVNDKYPFSLLKELEISEDKLPEIKPVGLVLEASDEFLKEIGLDRKIKVVLTSYDALCAFFGSGVKEEGDACDMSGTVTSLRVLTKKKLKEDEFRIFEQSYNDWNVVGGSNNQGGGLIEWVLETICPEHTHEELEKLAEHFSTKTGLLFLPYLLGERAPIWDNNVRGAFLGIERFHSRYDLARAVLESTGFILRHLIEVIEDNGITISRLFISGGLSKIDLVNQIKADITGKKVLKLKETESTSLGAYYLARKAIDPDFDVSQFVEIEKVYEPDMEKHEIYSRGYELFKKTYNHLQEFHEDRKKYLNMYNAQKVNL